MFSGPSTAASSGTTGRLFSSLWAISWPAAGLFHHTRSVQVTSSVASWWPSALQARPAQGESRRAGSGPAHAGPTAPALALQQQHSVSLAPQLAERSVLPPQVAFNRQAGSWPATCASTQPLCCARAEPARPPPPAARHAPMIGGHLGASAALKPLCQLWSSPNTRNQGSLAPWRMSHTMVAPASVPTARNAPPGQAAGRWCGASGVRGSRGCCWAGAPAGPGASRGQLRASAAGAAAPAAPAQHACL
jgi:hypothetical protein